MADFHPAPEGVLLDAGDQLEAVAKQLGIVCVGCGELIEPADAADDTRYPSAWEFLTLAPAREPTLAGNVHLARVGIEVRRDIVCSRESCADDRDAIRREASVVRPFRAWTILPTGPFGTSG